MSMTADGLRRALGVEDYYSQSLPPIGPPVNQLHLTASDYGYGTQLQIQAPASLLGHTITVDWGNLGTWEGQPLVQTVQIPVVTDVWYVNTTFSYSETGTFTIHVTCPPFMPATTHVTVTEVES